MVDLRAIIHHGHGIYNRGLPIHPRPNTNVDAEGDDSIHRSLLCGDIWRPRNYAQFLANEVDQPVHHPQFVLDDHLWRPTPPIRAAVDSGLVAERTLRRSLREKWMVS